MISKKMPGLKTNIKNIITHITSGIASRTELVAKTEHLTQSALYSVEPGVSNTRYCDSEVIVSLTTYGRRLYDVYLTIESVMRQTLKPNRIVLWLADDIKETDLPLVLQKQLKRGLEVRKCKDLLSYKKLIPALQAFPSAVIITVDDDNLYPFDLIENFISAYKKNPACIYCSRMHRIRLCSDKKPEKYRKWIQEYDGFDPSVLNFPTGSGGILYPPHCFTEEVLNEAVFMAICKHADDIWFKSMALLNGFMAQKIYTHKKFRNENVQDIQLSHININKGMNDTQLKAVFDKYKLYGKLVKQENVNG